MPSGDRYLNILVMLWVKNEETAAISPTSGEETYDPE
jgi:hypothetical protein